MGSSQAPSLKKRFYQVKVKSLGEILGCPLGGRKQYLFSGFYPSLARISKIVQISTQELDHRKQVKKGVVGVPRKCLEAKARVLAGKGEWAPFMDILALFQMWMGWWTRQRLTLFSPFMNARKARHSYFVQRISKCSLDGDKGLH